MGIPIPRMAFSDCTSEVIPEVLRLSPGSGLYPYAGTAQKGGVTLWPNAMWSQGSLSSANSYRSLSVLYGY
jgi:hypothetical protein